MSLTGSNNYSGTTTISAGTLAAGASANLGNAGATNNIVLNGGTLNTGATFVLTANRGIGLGPAQGATGGGGTIEVDATTTLTYGGSIASAGNTGSQSLTMTVVARS